jgi:probable F420-dependent oxidoreductase
MKVRIGVSLGPAGGPGQFAAAVDLLEQAGVDSLWLPENVYSPLVEPFTGMAFALSRTRRLKAGSGISVLPGRHPVLVAKQLASLAGLAPGRVLPVFGLQPAQPAERALFPVPAGQRAAVFDESLALLRLLLTTQTVSFGGSFFTVSGASVAPLPPRPLDIWLGGSAPGGLRRVGRLADGWLGSLRASIGRRRPLTDPELLVAAGWDDARRMIEQYVEAGLSKFVVRPATRPGTFGSFVDGFLAAMLPLQN